MKEKDNQRQQFLYGFYMVVYIQLGMMKEAEIPEWIL